MKKLLVCLFAATISLCAYAQPTLTALNTTPVVGQIDTFYGIDSAGITPGPSGAGVSWDFSGATNIDFQTYNYLPCTSTPYCDSFPTSNLCYLGVKISTSFTDSVYGYFKTSSTDYNHLGGRYLSSTNFDFVKFAILRYPMTFGDSYLDTTFVSSTSSGPLTYSAASFDSVEADAYGTLTTPTGTYSGVLRIKRAQTNASIYGRSETYFWFKPGYHNFLMALDLVYTPTGVIDAFACGYYANTVASTGITNTTNNSPTIKAYPNPATELLNINFNIADITGAALILSDVTGRIVKTITDIKHGANDISVNTTELTAGLYTLRLQTAAGNTTQKITVIQ